MEDSGSEEERVKNSRQKKTSTFHLKKLQQVSYNHIFSCLNVFMI